MNLEEASQKLETRRCGGLPVGGVRAHKVVGRNNFWWNVASATLATCKYGHLKIHTAVSVLREYPFFLF